MSDRSFPTLPGVVQVSREPFFSNATQSADSGRRFVVKKRTTPGFRYRMEVRALRPWLDEPRELFDFFTAHAGSYESFLYTDTFDSVTRRVRFMDDDLGLKRLATGVYVGDFLLETVVDP